MVNFHSFAYSCLIFPAPFIEETVFFPLDAFSLLYQRLVAQIAEGPFLGSLFCPLFYVSVFVPVPLSLCDHTFAIQLEIRHCDAPSFAFPSQQFLGDSGPFLVLHKFKDCLFKFFEKCLWYLDRDSIESVDCSG